jgi:hypothetical protein
VIGWFFFALAVYTGSCATTTLCELTLRRNYVAASRWARRTFFLLLAIILISVPNWTVVIAWSAMALIFLEIWLRNRPRRKRRLLRLLGHKARAVLAAMKSRMPKPNPRLAPVPA